MTRDQTTTAPPATGPQPSASAHIEAARGWDVTAPATAARGWAVKTLQDTVQWALTKEINTADGLLAAARAVGALFAGEIADIMAAEGVAAMEYYRRRAGESPPGVPDRLPEVGEPPTCDEEGGHTPRWDIGDGWCVYAWVGPENQVALQWSNGEVSYFQTFPCGGKSYGDMGAVGGGSGDGWPTMEELRLRRAASADAEQEGGGAS